MILENFTENNIICGNVDFQLQATQEAVSYSQYLVSFETLISVMRKEESGMTPRVIG